MKCLICGGDFGDARGLSYHLRSHKISSREYTEKFFPQALCLICKAPTQIAGIGEYKLCCCHRCSAIAMRQRLRDDPSRFASFSERVRENMKSFHAEIQGTEIQKRRIDRSTTAGNKTRSMMTASERVERFGWMNKLSAEEKKLKVEIILDKSLRKFWQELTPSDAQELFSRRGRSSRSIMENDIGEFAYYTVEARRLTERNYRKFTAAINPEGKKRGRGHFHVDHKLSLVDGFIHGVPIDVIAHPCNLEMLEETKNLKKNRKSSISVADLSHLCEVEICITDQERLRRLEVYAEHLLAKKNKKKKEHGLQIQARILQANSSGENLSR